MIGMIIAFSIALCGFSFVILELCSVKSKALSRYITKTVTR